MDDFIKELAKPSWWIGVIAVGFLINLASAYVKPLIDRILGRFWFASKQAADRKIEVIEKQAQELIASPQKVVELKLDILTDTMRGVFAMAFAILNFMLTTLNQYEGLHPVMFFPFDSKTAAPIMNSLLLAVGMFCVVLATVLFNRSMNKERVLRAYRKALHKESASVESPTPLSDPRLTNHSTGPSGGEPPTGR